MPRKEALITQSIAHFFVDFACFFLLAGSFTKTAQTTVLVGAGYLIFLLLSYGLRPFFGMILDQKPLIHSQAAGALLVALALLIPEKGAWFALFLGGMGSAFFHTGTLGESVCFARGYFSRIALILSTGVLGAALGTVFAQSVTLKSWVLSLILLACAIVCFFFAEARKYPKRIRSFRHSVSQVLPDWGILMLTLIPLFVISLVGVLLPSHWATGPLCLIPAAACLLGRCAGGIAADRFGPRKTVIACFGIALLLLTVFTHVPWAYCVGLGALCAPTSVCFGTATAALPERPHLAVGTCSLAILLGAIPGFFRSSPTTPVRLLCAGLMIVALAVSVGLYSDYCRLFDLRAKWKLRKGKRA